MKEKTFVARQAAYEKVRDDIIEMIRQGQLRTGDRLPSEKELARQFKLNHQTIRRGLADLAGMRIIERRVGSGSFVRIGEAELDRALSQPQSQEVGAFSTAPMMGVLCLTNYDAFAAELLGHLHRLSSARGLQIMIRVVNDFDDNALLVTQQMASQGCQAIIVPWTRQGEFPEALWALKRTSPIPVITPNLHERVAGDKLEPGWIDLVRMELAYRYFREAGHERIAFFGPYEAGNLTVSRRLFAYTRLANEAVLQTHIRLVKPSSAEVVLCLDQWAPLCEAAGGLAVICYDDDCALRLIAGAHKKGLRVPEDLALVGFNNVALGKMADPPLTTVEFGYDRLAEGLVEQAMAHIEKRNFASRPVFGERMIVRESCGGVQRFGTSAQRIADRIVHEVAQKHGVETETPCAEPSALAG
ncbi:MAG: hypothetical protein B9S32_14940 [Verrucomicrobia bacterium Tous-C9LFEB]|nr:MAG: hypothetical protein B9S32_14940 [Verrucomicrobia bacterium Tous-C9LFEB]